MQTFLLTSPAVLDTAIHFDGEQAWVGRLFGQLCSNGGEDGGPVRTQGLALLSTSEGRFEAEGLRITSITGSSNSVEITAEAGSLALDSRWEIDAETGIISRQDSLRNQGPQPVTIYRALARFTFPTGRYEVYRQESRWCVENQGEWTPLVTGTLAFRGEWGRTSRGGTPFAAIRERGARHAVGFHILPEGNWTLKASTTGNHHTAPMAVMEAGLSDEDLRLVLQPGQQVELPEILIQDLPEGEPHYGAPELHSFALQRYFADAKPEPPVIFNTWFYQFDRLDVLSLRKEVQAAKEVGCEIFVIDAGWFGPGAPGWFRAVGDWREKTESSFFGKMGEFANEVRAAGLRFGLWMEPERFAPDAPILQERPEWFIHADRNLKRINLEIPEAYAYQKDQISQLVERYGLAWMKVDFNFELGFDPSGAELLNYTRQWYRLMDEIRQKYPETFFEGCSSGAMRLDLNSLRHFDAHFLTDTVNPLDDLRIYQGALLRLPPGRLTRWVTLRSAGDRIPWYTDPMSDHWPDTIVTPSSANWIPMENVDVDFAVLNGMAGVLGFSGSLAELPESARERIRYWIAFYKDWRKFITGSVAHLLTPPGLISNREGWAAFQLQSLEDTSSLVFAYRLPNTFSKINLRLRDLEPSGEYSIRDAQSPDCPEFRQSGQALMDNGVDIEIPAPGLARLLIVQRLNA
jgi:alpha-galactosidase